MRKKVLSFLTVLCLLAGMMPMAAAPVYAAGHTHCVCGATHHSVGSHTSAASVEFTAWSDTTSLPSDAGNYYLTEDVTLSTAWTPADGTVLCLNGHTITAGTGRIEVIIVEASRSFTLTDCQSGGTLSGGNNMSTKAVVVRGDFTMFAGTITGCFHNAVHIMETGTANLFGGTLTGNNNAALGGGAVYATNGATLNLSGDISVSGNSASGGKGNIVVKDNNSVNVIGTLTGGAGSLGIETYGHTALEFTGIPASCSTSFTNNSDVCSIDWTSGHLVFVLEKSKVSFISDNRPSDCGTSSGSKPSSYIANLTGTTVKGNTGNLDTERYSWVGWNYSGQVYAEGDPITYTSGESSLYAVWAPKDCSVTLNTNGATSCTPLTSYTYKTGATLPTPVKTGYRFVGWYDNSGLAGSAVTAISATEFGDKEFWAKWDNSLTGTVNVSGAEKCGAMLTAIASGTNNTGTLSYQWQRDGVDISGAESYTYTLTADDIGHNIKVVVSSSAQPGTIESAATGTIAKADGPAAPSITFTVDDTSADAFKLKGATSAMEYKINSGSYTDASADIDLSSAVTAACTIKVRVKETATALAGAEKTITVTKASTPTASFTGATGILSGVSIGLQYKIDSGSWNTITGTSADLSSAVTAACTISIRQPASGTVLASDIQSITVDKAVTPSTADFEAASMQLSNVAAGMKYSINGGSSWTDISAATVDLDGIVTGPCTLTVVKKGAAAKDLDSDPVNITITQFPEPVLTVTQPAIFGGTGIIGTTTDHQSSDNGTDWSPCLGEMSALNPGTYYVRTAADGHTLASPTVTIVINAFAGTPEATPSAIFTAEDMILSGVANGMKYNIDGGAWTDITTSGSISLNGIVTGACTISVVKKGNGSTTIDSAPQNIIITKAAAPAALEAAALTSLSGTTSINTTAAHAISTDGVDYTDCTGASAGLTAGTYYVVTKASGTELTSDPVTIVIDEYVLVPAATPTTPVFEASTMALSGIDTTMKYNVDGGAWKDVTATSMNLSSDVTAACTINVAVKGDGDVTTDSAVKMIAVTKAATPSRTYGQPESIDAKGTLTAPSTEEISSNEGATYTSCDGSEMALEPGIYYLRVKGAGTVLASDAQIITINPFDATAMDMPAASFDTATLILSGVTSNMKYSIDGTNWTNITAAEVSLEGIVNNDCTISVVNKGDYVTTIDSPTQEILIVKAAAPALDVTQPTKDVATGEIATTGVEEISTDGGETWAPAASPETGLAPGTYLVRIPAAEGVLASDAQTVTIKAYTSPSSHRKPTAKPEEPKEEEPSEEPGTEPVQPETGKFADVKDNAYYAEAVKWAASEGITSGVGKNMFGVGESCTRAQMITFLWAAAGKPEVSTDITFSDISDNAYYAKAVKWAVASGITSGTSANRFSPEAAVNRAQCVTYLWIFAGKPEVSGNSFADVKPGDYFNKAAEWARSEGITAGIGNNMFGPDNSCLREQIVTFLFTAFN